VYRFVVLFAVACICLVLAGSAGAQTFSCPASTEDMLNYFVMKYPDRADYYRGPGNANPIYSAIFPDNGLSFATTRYFVWTKGREWISVGCEDIRSEFRVRPQHGTHMDRSADV